MLFFFFYVLFIRDYEASNDHDDLQMFNLLERSERKLNLELKQRTHEDIKFPDDNNDNDNDNNIEITESTNKDVEKLAKQQQNTNTNQGITQISLSVQSQLLVTPGMIAQLYFEVSNTRTEPIFHNFRVTDEKAYLRSLNQRR